MRPLTLVLMSLSLSSGWAATPPPPAPEARKPIPAADQVGDAVRQSTREVYMLSVQCTRDVLGPYMIGKTVPEGQAPQLSPGDKIHRQRGPFIEGSRYFNTREALACRDLESAALVLMESAQRIGSKLALREILPTIESRFKASPTFSEKTNLAKEIEALKKRL
jgi:hypothetical protein